MNKGLKAHLYATFLYLILIVIALFQNNNITNEVRYILAIGFFIIQTGIGMICYLEEWYFE
jgi:heme A synthase